jgi:hypothetical protein
VFWQQRGVSPNGERFDGPVIGLYRIREGKLARAEMFCGAAAGGRGGGAENGRSVNWAFIPPSMKRLAVSSPRRVLLAISCSRLWR